jgi:hypothetical protein
MNRAERRAMAARNRKAAPLPPARGDGRPLYYDINPRDQVKCFHCEKAGIKGLRYGHNEAFMNDPANAPDGSNDIFTVCRGHLPDNAVIYNPTSNLCRDKSGANTWMEDTPMVDSTSAIKGMSGIPDKQG